MSSCLCQLRVQHLPLPDFMITTRMIASHRRGALSEVKFHASSNMNKHEQTAGVYPKAISQAMNLYGKASSGIKGRRRNNCHTMCRENVSSERITISLVLSPARLNQVWQRAKHPRYGIDSQAITRFTAYVIIPRRLPVPMPTVHRFPSAPEEFKRATCSVVTIPQVPCAYTVAL